MAAMNDQNFHGGRVMKIALAASALGWLGVIVGLLEARKETYFAYLTAFSFATSIALGALIFRMVTHVVNAKWDIVLRRLEEVVASTLIVLSVLFIPLAFGLKELYPWADPSPHLSEHERHLLEHRGAYASEAGFLVRAGVYLLIWTGCAALLERRARGSEQRALQTAPAMDGEAGERAFSAAALPLVAIALTFAAFDWLMSLQPFWMSSIFGIYYFAGGFVAALGLLSVLAFAAAGSGAVGAIRPPHFHALGRLMFGFTVFWAYIAFFQALLITLPNRPEEVVFYRARLSGDWKTISLALLAVRFLAPFLMLLPRRIKFDGRAMAFAGGWIVAGNYLDIYWLVAPIRSASSPAPNLWDLAALLAITAPCVAFAAWRLHDRPLIPLWNPALPESIAYRSPL